MKKTFNIFGLAIIILLTGCTQEYKLERMYYHAYKKYIQISQKPSQDNLARIDEVIDDLNKIVKINPNWSGIKNVKYAIAYLYFLKKDFSKAREEFKKLISNFPAEIIMCIQARYFIGASYEYENKWDKAVAVYEKIMKDYPLSKIAMELSHYIADYYQRNKKYHLAEKVLREAITPYEKMINDYPQQERVIIVIEDFIIKTYEKLNDWDGVTNTLQKMVIKHYQTDRGAQSLYQLAKIYESRKKIKEAINFYKQFIQEYPEHKLTSIAKTKISSLQLVLPKENK